MINSVSENMSKVVVKKAGKKGKGVYAAKNLRKGEHILVMKGKILTTAELVKSSNYNNNHCTPIGKDKYMVFGSPEKFINHACSPNVYDKNGVVYAMKNIKEGEELAFDYCLNAVDDWKMQCHCKSKDCRKTVVGNFFELPKETQSRYLPFVDNWFRKEYKKELDRLKPKFQ